MRFTTHILGAALLMPLFSSAQCTDLFISEYMEGTGNNKGLEFYNPTSEAIDLSAYQLQRWSNGEGTATDWVDLLGTIEAFGTWVLVNGQTEDVELGGGAISPAVDPAMQAFADQLDNPYPAPTYMNGDDALVLVKNGDNVVDIFGKPGEDPGVAWTNDEANGYIDIGDGATWLTSNHTLRRKYEVQQGVTVPPISFNTFAEYDTLAVNTWDGLGSHSCACNPSQVETMTQSIVTSVYPNPSLNGTITLEADQSIERVSIFGVQGALVYDQRNETAALRWTIENLQAGAYLVQLHFAGGRTFAHQVLVR